MIIAYFILLQPIPRPLSVEINSSLDNWDKKNNPINWVNAP